MTRTVAACDDAHVVPLARAPDEEAPVEVVHQVGRAPVELGADRGHVGRGEGRDHHPAQRHREDGRVDDRLDEARLLVREVGVEDEARERGEDPGPGAHRVVRDVEPERGEERVLLVLRAEDPLRDVAAAARLRPRVPGGPPVHGDVDEEGEHRHPGGADVRDEGQDRAAAPAGRRPRRVEGVELLLQGLHPAHRPHRADGEHDHHPHLQGELEEVHHEDAPEPRERRDEGGDQHHAEDDQPGPAPWSRRRSSSGSSPSPG